MIDNTAILTELVDYVLMRICWQVAVKIVDIENYDKSYFLFYCIIHAKTVIDRNIKHDARLKAYLLSKGDYL